MKQTNKENLKKKSALKIVYSHDLKARVLRYTAGYKLKNLFL